MKKLLIAFYTLLFCGFYSQEISEMPKLLDKGSFMTEYFFSYQKTKKTENFGFANFTFRYVFHNKLEAIAFVNYIKTKTLEEKTEGFTPIIFALKTPIFKQKKLLPETSFLVGLQIPKFASKNLQADRLALNGLLTVNYDFSRTHWVQNFGVFWDGISTEKQAFYTNSFGYFLKKNHKLYAEVYGNFASKKAPNFNWQIGTEYVLSDIYFINISGGTSLRNFNLPYFSVGFNYLLKKKN